MAFVRLPAVSSNLYSKDVLERSVKLSARGGTVTDVEMMMRGLKISADQVEASRG